MHRHQVRLRHRPVRRLHRACRRGIATSLLRDAGRAASNGSQITTIEAVGRDRGRRQGAEGLGSISRSSSAATASRARSWPRPRCSPPIQRRATPISTRRWPATSAAAAPMPAFARPSSRPHNPLPAQSKEVDMTTIFTARLPRESGSAAAGAAWSSLNLPACAPRKPPRARASRPTRSCASARTAR